MNILEEESKNGVGRYIRNKIMIDVGTDGYKELNDLSNKGEA